MTAVVVDDDRATRKFVGRILADLGFATRTAGDGREALEALAADAPPDLVVVDWRMPMMAGIDVVRAVRADPRYAATRVVMATSEDDPDRLAEALAAGADEYVMKPFTADMVSDKLRLLGIEVAGGV